MSWLLTFQRNNDHSIKIWNVDKWRSDGSIKLPAPINHCSVSPDKQSMVCVGDTSDVFLFDISTTGSFHHQATFTASNDSAFSTSFSCTSSMFAVASQDGVISVWDRRFARNATPESSSSSSSGKLKTLKTTRAGSPYGAARCVKFSQGPLDLLMFTEQKEYVHLVDARTFDKTQILSLGELEDGVREPDIGGACFSSDCKSVLVGSERAIWQWVESPLYDANIRKLIRGVEKCFRVLNCIEFGFIHIVDMCEGVIGASQGLSSILHIGFCTYTEINLHFPTSIL